LAYPWAFFTVLEARLVRAEKIAKLLLLKDTIDLTQSRERNRAENGRPWLRPGYT
jgi:hypothetical protein